VSETQYKVLWSFQGGTTDGMFPEAGLVADANGNLFGATASGGNSKCRCGVIFELSPNENGEWNETVIYSFCQNQGELCNDAKYPEASLLINKAGDLYGTSYSGGNQPCSFLGSGCGTVFKLTPTASGKWKESVLYNFCSNNVNGNCLDGANPLSQLVVDRLGNLYGTTSTGGKGGTEGVCCTGGTVFELTHGTSGWTDSVLYNFCANGGPVCLDGTGPHAGVTFDKAGNLYGTTQAGGDPNSLGGGTVYKLSPGLNGWIQTVLLADRGPFRHGATPLGPVSIDFGGHLYTTFSAGGAFNLGGVVKLDPTDKHKLYWFNGQDGSSPMSGVLVDSKNAKLYGTTFAGGQFQGGVVFQIVSPAQEDVLYSFCSEANCDDGAGPTSGVIEDQTGNLYGTTKSGGQLNLGVVYEIIADPASKTVTPASINSLLGR